MWQHTIVPSQTSFYISSIANIDFPFIIVNGVYVEIHLLKSPSADGFTIKLWGRYPKQQKQYSAKKE